MRLVFLFILLVMPFLRLTAQVAGSGDLPKVGHITIRFIGSANVSEEVVRSNMQLSDGSVMDEALIDRDIRNLYSTGLFELIEFKREQVDANKVNLVVELTPKYRVQSIEFIGNKHYKNKALIKKIKISVNAALDERQIQLDAKAIREYYQKSGYNQVKVDYEIERNRAIGKGVVRFKIDEGAKVHINRVDFTGNDHVSTRKLRKQMDTRKWNWLSWLTDKGRFRDEVFETDLIKLRDYYREQGYLDVDIDPDKVQLSYPSESRMRILIPITEGRSYSIGEISITGNKLYTSEELMSVLKQKTGDVFAPSMIDKDVQALEDYYGKDGYLDARVHLIRKPNLKTGAIDVEYAVTESDQFHVESINIDGNTKTKSIVILRELNLGPGDIFNTVKMKVSKLRLENTRFFDEVNLSPESTNIPGRRNLKISVKEARTGNLSFGAGFSSLESAVIFAEVTQSNFDLFNRKSFFQGDGQKFRLRLQLGSKSSEAILSFEEPWLFEQELALGFNLYRTSSDYNSNYYNEVRLGAEVYLRKRLFELVEGRLSYILENVEIDNVDAAAPGFIKALPSNQTVSKVNFQLLRDTRDRLINTTRGNRSELITELAGGPLGFDADYYRIEARTAQFVPTTDVLNQVLSVIARGGVIESYGSSSSVPYYDRFFLGGPSTLRGFKYRDVGPKDAATGEPAGGGTYGFFSMEYSMDVVEPLRFAVFYDAGFVNTDAYDFDPSNYNDNFGFGLRLMVAGAPLSIDFGIPITSDRFNSGGMQFNFSFGTRF